MTDKEIKAYGELPTIDESLGDLRNEKPKRAYSKEEVFIDELGYQRFRDTKNLVLNADGSARMAAGRPNAEAIRNTHTKSMMSRAERRAERRQKMLESKADIKQRDLLKRLDQNYFDCVVEVLDLFEDPETTKDQKLRILFKLMDHAYPKLSVLNTNETSGAGFTFNINTGVIKDGEEQKAEKDKMKEQLKKALQ